MARTIPSIEILRSLGTQPTSYTQCRLGTDATRINTERDTTRYKPVENHGELGRGRYSSVIRARDSYSSMVVAIKIMLTDKVSEADFKREIHVLQKVQRLNSSLFGKYADLLDFYSTTNAFCIVFPRYAGSLHALDLGRTPRFQLCEISLQLIQAVGYLHNNNIIHTDINPGNIMLLNLSRREQTVYSADGQFHEREFLISTDIRIIDFGSVGEAVVDNEGVVGTVGFRSPEVIMGWKWSETIDHFATGCVIAGLVTAKPLLVGSTGIAQDDLKAMEIALGRFPKKLRRSLTQTRILLENSERGANATGKLRKYIRDRDLHRTLKELTNYDPQERGSLAVIAKRNCFRV
ncbi:kinase-like domain-containing protein [Mycena rebaudengoi]|nr:kinase-like domain-containing protein [Mycena rebaudengoi]